VKTNTNIHVVTQFAEKVWLVEKRSDPQARLLVAGRCPAPVIKAPAYRAGIKVTGEVLYPADYLARALVCASIPCKPGPVCKTSSSSI
jgi:hypothetical protein